MSYKYYNPNPVGRSVGDCTVRAIAKALDQTWEETYVGLALEGFVRGDMPDSDDVWGHYLKSHGFTRHWLPNECPDGCTVGRFTEEHPEGTFILSMPGRHAVAVVDGVIYDSWDSSGVPALLSLGPFVSKSGRTSDHAAVSDGGRADSLRARRSA